MVTLPSPLHRGKKEMSQESKFAHSTGLDNRGFMKETRGEAVEQTASLRAIRGSGMAIFREDITDRVKQYREVFHAGD